MATATSNWNGLPTSQPIYAAIRSPMKACPMKAQIEDNPTITTSKTKRIDSIITLFVLGLL
ncbi:MAG: hypothetical protein QFX38_03680 [Methanothermobacter sp.]|nr:hypothetical protein [Methanothermobacter sp.]